MYSVLEKLCVVGDEIQFIVNNVSQEIGEGVIVGELLNKDCPPSFEIRTKIGLLKISKKNLHRNMVHRKLWDSEADRKKVGEVSSAYPNNVAFKKLLTDKGLTRHDVFEMLSSRSVKATKSKIDGWRRADHDRRFVPMSDIELQCVELVING